VEYWQAGAPLPVAVDGNWLGWATIPAVTILRCVPGPSWTPKRSRLYGGEMTLFGTLEKVVYSGSESSLKIKG
jgi:hypothetical protein